MTSKYKHIAETALSEHGTRPVTTQFDTRLH